VNKYVLRLYRTPYGPVDGEVLNWISQLPQTAEFKNWKPEGYFDFAAFCETAGIPTFQGRT
jgi:hypothetical protein